MQPAKHILCIHLPHWPIVRYGRRCRDGRSLAPDAAAAALAVIHTSGQRRWVIDASPAARSAGVRDGMSAAEARALCPSLACIEWNRAADRRALDALGRWMMRFTPVVACGWEGSDEIFPPPAVLFLDVTGCERLFGGIEAIVREVRRSLLRFAIASRVAAAPTLGAAWAIASSANTVTAPKTRRPGPSAFDAPDSQNSSPLIVTADALHAAIDALPTTSLRLGEDMIAALHRLGLKQVGDLLRLPREQLPARFGNLLLQRLDQLTGERAEPLTRLVCDPPVTARAGFEAAIESLENIWRVFEKLLALVLADLTRRGRGVRQLRMALTPDRGWDRPVVIRTIALSRPHRDRATLLNLIRCEADQVDCEHGFIRFQLDVPLHEPLSDAQVQLFERECAEEAMELDKLFQRLRARLGADGVIQPIAIESHIPERAWRPAQDDVMTAPRSIAAPAANTTPSPRPLTLLPVPVEIRVTCEPSDDRTGRPRQFSWQGNVHRLTQVVGPERIAGEWWRGHHHTRDYYDVEDEPGRRYWLFRVLHVQWDRIIARWYLHGQFA